MTTQLSALVILALLLPGCRGQQASSPDQAVPPPRQKRAPTGVDLLVDDPRLRCSPDPEVRCTGLLPVRRPGTPRPAEVAILRSGEEAFRARMGSLREARRSIRIQALIFKADEAGLHIAELLKKRRAEGLEVRVIVDAASNLDWRTQWMYFDLKRHGIEVEGYEALYLQWVPAEVTPTDPLRPNKRFHDKVWVVDGEDPERGFAIVGGLNIGNEYFRLDPDVKLRWRDQDVAVRGVLVDDVRQVFDRNFEYCKELKGRLLPGRNPDNIWRLTRGVLDRIRAVQLPHWRRPQVVLAVQAEGHKKWSPAYRPVTARFLQSRPRLQESFIAQAYERLIDRCRRRLLLANAYFIPSRPLLATLTRAARRGVRLTIITNSPDSNDIRAIALVSRHLYLPLLAVNQDPEVVRRKGRIELREWIGPAAGEGTLHSKLALFDEDLALVGSYNLDPRSERLNSETALVFRSRRLVEELEQLIERDYLPSSRPISLEEARGFRQPDDLGERFEKLFYLPLKDWL